MGSALGTTAPRPSGTRWADIRDFGALPVSAGGVASTNRAAIQAAVDYLGSTQVPGAGAGTVFIPSGDWTVDRPIFLDKVKVGIRGEGAGLSRLTSSTAHDLLVFGVNRTPGGVSVTPDHLVDLFTGGPGGTPRLDSTAVSGAGQRWGLRTKGDCHIVQQGGAFDAGPGDFYETVRQLTVEFAVDLTNAPGTGNFAGPSPSAPLLGMCRVGTPSPWMIGISSNCFQVQFRTAAPGIDAGVTRGFAFTTLPTNPGLYRVAVQIDLVNAQVSAFVNGSQVALLNVGVPLGADFVASSNLTFAQNQHCPFGLGSLSVRAGEVSDGPFSGACDLTFFGVKLLSGLVYRSNGTGTAQARIDGQPADDYRRYFRYESSQVIAMMNLTDTPSRVALDRVLTVTGMGATACTAYFLDNAGHGSPFSCISSGAVRDLTLRILPPYYGRTIVTGWSLGLVISDCEIYGGFHGIGSMNMGANYPLTVNRCFLSGSDAAVYLYFTAFAMFRDITLGGASRAAIRLYLAQLKVDNLFSQNVGNPDYCIKGVESSYDVLNANWDNEGNGGGATIAAYYASASATYPISSVISITNSGTASVGDGAAVVYLDDQISPQFEDGNSFTTCTFNCRDLGVPASVRPRSVVTVVGPRWQGQISAETSLTRPRWIEPLAGAGFVTSRHLRHIGPPRDGAWDAGMHLLDVPTPAASQFTLWRCVASGAYGTPTQPRWAGCLPLDDGLSLAAYISDHSYWAASGAPAGSAGFWSNAVFDFSLNALFGGPPATGTPALYAGLGERTAARVPIVFEPPIGVNGYARVPLSGASFAASSGGASSYGAAIAFPTATGPWIGAYSGLGVVQVLLLCNAPSGGNVVASMDVAPIPIAAGVAPSFAAGAIGLARAATSPQGSFSDRVHDWVNNLNLKNQAFTVPAVYLALSTAPANVAAAPSEPPGGGYARVATTSASWARAQNPGYYYFGSIATGHTVRNATSLTFPAPTGGWGTAQSVYLMDAAAGGNVLAAANLAVPRTISGGDPARSFAPGALWITRS